MTPWAVLLSPVRRDMPGGRPLALHVNGAVPPLITWMARLHGTPSVQSLKGPSYGRTWPSVGGVPITSIARRFLYDTLLLSVTVVSKLYLVGPPVTVPEITPAELIERPFGRQQFALHV